MQTTDTTDDTKAQARPAKIQLTPADWITAAITLLTDKSIDSVRVDILAKELNVTRGSFYWHFKDRNDLLERMLITWRDAATAQIIQRFEKSGTTSVMLIKQLISLPFRGRSALYSASVELSIRAWARRDAMARKVVDEMDAQRLSYIGKCFVSLGYDETDAQLRAFMLYSYILTESLVRTEVSETLREARRQCIEDMVLSPAKPAAKSRKKQ